MSYSLLRVAIQNIMDSGGTYGDIIAFVMGVASVDITGRMQNPNGARQVVLTDEAYPVCLVQRPTHTVTC